MSKEPHESILSVPIRSLEELKSWKPVIDRSRLQFGQKCFAPTGPARTFSERLIESVPKTLICHDMKGGYLDDSHHFITIPPPCWVHAAHLHGVPILGTLITEWDQGKAICRKIFSSKIAVDAFVDTLTELTLYHNCDGWLINIENPMEETLIDNVLYFLRRLKQELVLAGNFGKIIWYDSVTRDGELDWQNELNEKNRAYFDSCDGIFLNYVWKPENLANSAIAAGERIYDVYVGIDVFGRNCFGGGGFNTDAAFSVIKQYNLSAAVFAPGWVYECHPTEQFKELSFRFWSLLFPYMNMHSYTSLAIRTSFCPGYGQGKYDSGQLVDDKPWHNMSRQRLQPCLSALRGLFEITADTCDIFKCGSHLESFGKQELCDTEAFNGGGCLYIHSFKDAVFPLFFCDIPVTKPMTLAIALKAKNTERLLVKLGLLRSNASDITYISCPLMPCMDQFRSTADDDHLCELVVSSKELDSRCDYLDESLFRSTTNSSGWDLRFLRE